MVVKRCPKDMSREKGHHEKVKKDLLKKNPKMSFVITSLTSENQSQLAGKFGMKSLS